ncbi:oxidase EvaA [Saccharothrix ecbatanensis]|uniref:Oxidase EvaA n=1 Tax=Saccharothrix ecbatanensis TaxID=1105145 RepID=A0A7W9HGJ0_9PSEU|nr:NDP-hexose 2,3-dehydratase family protein [Saccharothrix ecbatanensis]MBB5801563.1 oxidase EvaA [Saccharothrix ecbatanensis]
MSAPTRPPTGPRLAESMLIGGGTEAVHAWLARTAEHCWMRVDRVPLDEVAGWRTEPDTGNIRHHTGRFFSVESLAVDLPGAAVPHWRQPIINQPEIGILGILAREVDGVLHFLMQAKHEPGNPNGLQLSPTVQATRSNYTRVHQGKAIPYLEHFRDTSGHRVVVDIRQSEQGAWFYRKRNRNMVVEVDGDIEVHDGFRWLTLGEVADLMAVPDLVNMDARTVLACLPSGGAGLAGAATDAFTTALVRSLDPATPGVHTIGDVLSWITEVRTRTDLHVALGPLAGLTDWTRVDGRIAHRSGGFFTVVGVDVEAGGREVAAWSQPMIEPVGTGVIAFLVKEIGGTLHVLTHARTEPGYADVTELAPTVQCVPETYDHLPARPRFLDEVLTSSRVRFDTVLSEEGGRFLGARNRYMIVETDADVAADDPEYRWLTPHQYEELLRHSFYVNIQARSLLLCLRSLVPRG